MLLTHLASPRCLKQPQLRKDDFCIPYLSLVLKDIAAVDASEPTYTDDGQVRCSKLDKLAAFLGPFERFQVKHFSRVWSYVLSCRVCASPFRQRVIVRV